jgi:RecA/RadA recombinase
MTNDLFKELLKGTGNEYATIAADGITAGDFTEYIDTGSYTLNALLSGSIYGGLPSNKITCFAGEPSTGKTYFALNILRRFLENNPNGFCFIFESESALSKEMIENRGIDARRVGIIPVATVQEFRTQAVKILDRYMEKKERLPMLFILDSLGNLSTEKEISAISDGKESRDMSRAQLIRGAFRVLTLKLGKANVPMVVTNHVFQTIGSYIPQKEMSGGQGLAYAASTIVFLSKKKDKTDNEVTGAIVTATLKKARLTIENKKVETLLEYSSGLDPYYGLLQFAEKFGIFKKVSTRYELPNGEKAFESHILRDPEKYFTPEILDLIDEKCKTEFLYGKTNLIETENADDIGS